MPLVAGSYKSEDDLLFSLLYALDNACKQIDGKSHFEEISGYRYIVDFSALINEKRTSVWLTYEPNPSYPTYKGNSILYLGAQLTDYSPMAISVPSSLGHGISYGGYANCLAAYDEDLESFMFALYGGTTPAKITDTDLYSDTGPLIIYFAKNTDANYDKNIFCTIGYGLTRYDSTDEYKYGIQNIIDPLNRNLGAALRASTWPNINHKDYPTRYKRLVYLVKMPLYDINNNLITDPDRMLCSTMMMGATVPEFEDNDPNKFSAKISVGGKNFISFINHGSQTYRHMPIDPWCPY